MRRTSIALCALLVARAAAAQGDPFQGAFEQGLAAFQARDYEGALERFRRSYVLSRRPELLFNVGLTLDRLGRRDEAIATLQQFIALQPASPQRPDAERRIATLRATPAPVATPSPVGPARVAAPASPPPPQVAVLPPPPPRAAPWWPWVTLGVGVASGVAGAVLLATASDPGADPAVLMEAQYLDAADGAQTRRVAGAVLLGLGGAAAVAGVIGLVAGRPRREAPALQVYAWPVRGGGVAGLSLRAF